MDLQLFLPSFFKILIKKNLPVRKSTISRILIFNGPLLKMKLRTIHLENIKKFEWTTSGNTQTCLKDLPMLRADIKNSTKLEVKQRGEIWELNTIKTVQTVKLTWDMCNRATTPTF